MHLTQEQREIGKQNFLTILGEYRRDFLEKSLTAPSMSEYYFGYPKLDGKPVRAGIVGTRSNEGCAAMIEQSNPEYLRYVAFHDIRPSQIKRARDKAFTRIYGAEEAKKVKFHPRWEDMLADKDLEVIVIATPLWTHAKFAIEALGAGKHVFCEKLMAHSIGDCKRMVRASEKAKKLLAVGHQRHYSTLYDNALAVIKSGVLGEIKHIRALWHRNNTWTKPDGSPHDSWSPPIPEADQSLDASRFGYKDVKELVRWRLYNRTGGGLMAELGSHQLDAASLFLNKVHPKRVSAVGGTYYFKDDRECEDHVYCMYEMPNGVVVTYSSINTNALEGYGEVVTGTKGTLMIMNERDLMLFREREPRESSLPQETHVTLGEDEKSKKPELDRTDSPSLLTDAALAKLALDKAARFTPVGQKKKMVNRGYQQELEAFAHAVRNPGAKLRCDGRVAMADAVMALSANVAMRQGQPLTFQKAWYDPATNEVPDADQDSPLGQQSS